MIISLNRLISHPLQARDGELGHISDVYFDDSSWRAKYFVIDTRKWFPGRKVILPPEAISTEGLVNDHILVKLTCDQIQKSPSFDAHIPISRLREMDSARGTGTNHDLIIASPTLESYAFLPGDHLGIERELQTRSHQGIRYFQDSHDGHLRSSKKLCPFHALCLGGGEVTVKDLLFDWNEWDINHLVVDTGGWMSSHKVICPMVFVDAILWEEDTMELGLRIDVLDESPVFEEDNFSEDVERRIVKHYFDSSTHEANRQAERNGVSPPI